MGFGDDIMATAYVRGAKKKFESVGEGNLIFAFGPPEITRPDLKFKPHWSEVFENHPDIAQPGVEYPRNNTSISVVPDYPGCRFYIDYQNCEVNRETGQINRFAWHEDFKATPGDMYFSIAEKSGAAALSARTGDRSIIIEPNVAGKDWTNRKRWPFERWQAVVDALKGEVNFLQFATGYELENVHMIRTNRFREACAFLSCAGGFLGTDGGLHHASAALNVPAVVLWGHYTSPKQLGYDNHRNIRNHTDAGCGVVYGECPVCDAEGGGLGNIEVDEVVTAIREYFTVERMMEDRRAPHIDPEAEEESIFKKVE